MLQLARVARDSGVDRFAVSEPEAAIRLRLAGFIDEEILILRSVSAEADVADIIEAKAVATVGSYDAAVVLNGMAERHGEVVETHIKLDTGMGRYGFLPEEFDRIVSIYRFMSKLSVTGLYTHFYNAFAGEKRARAQLDTLLEVAGKLRDAGYDPGCVHAANSAFFMKYDFSGTDAVRIGSAFTGRLAVKGNFGLQPVGHARCTVAEIRWLNRGHTVGYGGAYVTRKPTRIAVIPFGYADGFNVSRANDIFRFRDLMRYLFTDGKLMFSNKKLYVQIRGKKAQVLGHIGMVHVVADVTDIACEVGDPARFEVNPLFVNPLLERLYE
jgi:alanine racemase